MPISFPTRWGRPWPAHRGGTRQLPEIALADLEMSDQDARPRSARRRRRARTDRERSFAESKRRARRRQTSDPGRRSCSSHAAHVTNRVRDYPPTRPSGGSPGRRPRSIDRLPGASCRSFQGSANCARCPVRRRTVVGQRQVLVEEHPHAVAPRIDRGDVDEQEHESGRLRGALVVEVRGAITELDDLARPAEQLGHVTGRRLARPEQRQQRRIDRLVGRRTTEQAAGRQRRESQEREGRHSVPHATRLCRDPRAVRPRRARHPVRMPGSRGSVRGTPIRPRRRRVGRHP
jgi:hypothetical protein